MKKKFKNRKGIAAVEAAVCLPMLVVIWLGTVEVSQIISLKQQGQLLATAAANRIVESNDSFAEICLLYTSPSPRDQRGSRMPSSA